jgi:hypothetical protein
LSCLGIIRGHFVYFTAKWFILWPFGTFCGHLGIFFPLFGMLYREKSGSPARLPATLNKINLNLFLCLSLQAFFRHNFFPLEAQKGAKNGQTIVLRKHFLSTLATFSEGNNPINFSKTSFVRI